MCDKIQIAFFTCLATCLGWNNLSAQSSKALDVVWESDSTDISGRVSTDGNWLSYIDWNNGDLDIRENLTGRSLKIFGQGNPGRSVFSPDGHRIAFEWNGNEIRIADLKGDSSKIIISNADLHDWSADGKSLLVCKKNELGFVQISTGEFAGIISIQERILHARVSPDGKFVALTTVSSDPTRYEIYIVSIASGRRSLFVSCERGYQAPVWSQDGKTIFYISDRGNKPRIWQKSFYERNPKNIGKVIADLPDAYVVMLGIDSKGTIYLGTEDRGGLDVYLGIIDWEKKSVNEIMKIPSAPFRGSRRAVFSPSGSRIAFMQKARGYVVHPGWQTPVVRDLITGAEKLYPTYLTLRDEPLWDIDGAALYFAAPPKGTIGEKADLIWSFYRLELNTASYTEIGKAASAGIIRLAGATSNSIVYLVDSYGKSSTGSIFSFNLSSGSNDLMYRIENNTLYDAALSPDGSRFAIATNDGDGNKGLYIIKKGETKTFPITTVRPNARAQLMWFASGNAIITSGRVNGKQGIWRIPLDGSAPEALNIPASDVTEVRLSADGRRIAFTRTNQLFNQIITLK